MQYGHMPIPDRRDSNLADSNGSTPFQSHQALGQALGTHLSAGTSYTRPGDTYRISPSPSPIHPQNGAPPPAHPSLYTVPSGQLSSSPAMKRKPTDSVLGQVKRRREADIEPAESFDADGNQAGAKHWTDEEKTKLFKWLMGPGQDDHWNSLRATKNSCLRECSGEVFGGKKTYQALKGCYERNFNLFKQIYAFESYSPHSPNISGLSEADRLREYERRLHLAKKAGCDVGNISARTIDHWHRMGWYELFYRRWHGDPATTRPSGSRPSGGTSGLGDDDGDDEPTLDYTDPIPPPITPVNHDRTHQMTFMTHNQPTQHPPAQPPTPASTTPMSTATTLTSNSIVPSLTTTPMSPDASAISITMSHSMASAYLQFLQTQTNHGKMKLEYLRRREEREEKESRQRHEIERLRLEREAAEFEHNKLTSNIKQKADKAIELLGNPMMDASIKQAAGDYLKKLFSTD